MKNNILKLTKQFLKIAQEKSFPKFKNGDLVIRRNENKIVEIVSDPMWNRQAGIYFYKTLYKDEFGKEKIRAAPESSLATLDEVIDPSEYIPEEEMN